MILSLKKRSNAWSITLCSMLAVLVVMLPDLAAATASGGAAASGGATAAGTTNANTNQISQVLCNMIILLQGNIARGIAAGGVIFLGFSLFLGKISWGTAMALGIGLGAIFGAQEIVNMASGGSGGLNCANQALRGIALP